MTRIDLVRDKIRRIRHVVELLERCLPDAPAALARDEDALHLVAFRVYLGLQEGIDLASHIIADEGWGPAASLREHFVILARQGVIDADIAASFGDGVKIRNLIGHAYGDVDPVKLHAEAEALPKLLTDYCRAVLVFAEARVSGEE